MPCACPEKSLRNKIMQLNELIALIKTGRHNRGIEQLSWKIFLTHHPSGVPFLENLSSKWEDTLKQFEEEDKTDALKKWKTRIRTDLKYRSDWIAKKRISYYPQVHYEGRCSLIKIEAVELIQKFDDDMK